MKMWGYFDAGGTHTNPDRRGRQASTVSVAGYLGTASQWYEFDRLWMKRLKSDRLAYFHMSSFMANKYIFEKCATWDETRKLELLEDLISIIANNVTYGIGMAVHRADYNRIVGEEPEAPALLGSPYAFCAFRCFESGTDWSIKARSRDAISYVFEQGDQDHEQIRNTHAFICKHEGLKQKYRMGSLTFDPGDNTPLQAADMLTWELNREMYRQLYPEPEYAYTRDTLVALMARIEGVYKHYGEDELKGYLQDFIRKERTFIFNIPERIAGLTLDEIKAEQEEYEKEKRQRKPTKTKNKKKRATKKKPASKKVKP